MTADTVLHIDKKLKRQILHKVCYIRGLNRRISCSTSLVRCRKLERKKRFAEKYLHQAIEKATAIF